MVFLFLALHLFSSNHIIHIPMKFTYKILVPVVCLLLIGTQAYAQKKKAIKGNGKVTTETRDFSSFTGVKVGGAFDVVIEKGNSHEVKIEADENVMSHIKMEVKEGILRVKMDGWVQKVNKLNLHITMKEMDLLSASGASDVEVEDEFSADEFELSTSGASDVDIHINSEVLTCSVSGSSDLNLAGRTEEMKLNISGSADLNASDFQAEDVNVMSSGSSSARINASGKLVATASGSSDINCGGNPGVTSIKTSGAADIHID